MKFIEMINGPIMVVNNEEYSLFEKVDNQGLFDYNAADERDKLLINRLVSRGVFERFYVDDETLISVNYNFTIGCS